MQCNIDNEIKLIAHDAYDKQSFWKSMCNYDESAFRINALVDSYEKYIYHSYTVNGINDQLTLQCDFYWNEKKRNSALMLMIRNHYGKQCFSVIIIVQTVWQCFI